MATPIYQPRDPGGTLLYNVVAEYLETFLASIDADPTAQGLPSYVRDELHAYLKCGILAHGFLRLSCDTCSHKMLLAFKRPCKDARALQTARLLSLVCRQTPGRDSSAPGRAGDSLKLAAAPRPLHPPAWSKAGSPGPRSAPS